MVGYMAALRAYGKTAPLFVGATIGRPRADIESAPTYRKASNFRCRRGAFYILPRSLTSLRL